MNTFSTYLSSKLDSTLCNQNIGEGESNIDDKYVEKVFNKCSTRQSCIFLKFTSYKIGTLDSSNQICKSRKATYLTPNTTINFVAVLGTDSILTM